MAEFTNCRDKLEALAIRFCWNVSERFTNVCLNICFILLGKWFALINILLLHSLYFFHFLFFFLRGCSAKIIFERAPIFSIKIVAIGFIFFVDKDLSVCQRELFFVFFFTSRFRKLTHVRCSCCCQAVLYFWLMLFVFFADRFDWATYLKRNNAIAAPMELFEPVERCEGIKKFRVSNFDDFALLFVALHYDLFFERILCYRTDRAVKFFFLFFGCLCETFLSD